QRDDLRPGGLGLQQVGGEVRIVQGVANGAHHLAAVGGNDGGGLLLHVVAGRDVLGNEEPGVAALVQHRLRRAVGDRVVVDGPVDGVGRAGVAGEAGGDVPGRQEDLVGVAQD